MRENLPASRSLSFESNAPTAWPAGHTILPMDRWLQSCNATFPMASLITGCLANNDEDDLAGCSSALSRLSSAGWWLDGSKSCFRNLRTASTSPEASNSCRDDIASRDYWRSYGSITLHRLCDYTAVYFYSYYDHFIFTVQYTTETLTPPQPVHTPAARAPTPHPPPASGDARRNFPGGATVVVASCLVGSINYVRVLVVNKVIVIRVVIIRL